MKDQGLGDTIQRFTTMTGIKKLSNTIYSGCNCDKRKDWLNKNFPYKGNK